MPVDNHLTGFRSESEAGDGEIVCQAERRSEIEAIEDFKSEIEADEGTKVFSKAC